MGTGTARSLTYLRDQLDGLLLKDRFGGADTGGREGHTYVEDILESLAPSYGGIYVSSSAETTIAAQSTYVKAAGTTASLGITPRNVTEATTNRLTFTGASPRIFLVIATVNTLVATATQLNGVKIAKNGTVIDASEVKDYQAVAAEDQALTAMTLVSLSSTDYVEVFLGNHTDTANMTWSTGQLVAVQVGVA